MKTSFFLLLSLLSLFSACIGDDIIEDSIPERLSINNAIDSLQINTSYTVTATFFNNIGQVTSGTIDWVSTNETVATIDGEGKLSALTVGSTAIIASVVLADNSRVEDQFELIVSQAPVEDPDEPAERSGTAESTSSYVLEGDFILRQDGDNLIIEFADNYVASDGLPGFYLYLTNNPNTINNALEVSPIDILEGAHSYLVPGVDIQAYDYLLFYCKPFSVKVGEGVIE
jgi:hypothetical protein